LIKTEKSVTYLKGGQQIIVQIAKEPISTKGPRLTSEISIAGRNLVLMPFSDKVSISQKINNSEEKVRLKNSPYILFDLKTTGLLFAQWLKSKKLLNLTLN
jgi:Rne/Rng family ribonuclease